MTHRLLWAVTLLVASGSLAAPGGVGALCDVDSACAEGLTCRDGFCLQLEPAPTPEPPAQESPPPPEPVISEPVAPEPSAEEPAEPAEPAEPVEPVEPAEPAEPAEPLELPAPAPPGPPAPAGLDPAKQRSLAEDATGQVWGGAGARALAVPGLACGGCLLGAGVCTGFGGQSFIESANRGRFTDFPESNDNARIGGYIGLATGIAMAVASVPFLLVGEGAAIYAGLLDVQLCGSALGLEDGWLIGLGAGRGLAWTVMPQLLGCGAGLCGAGAWVWVASNGVNAYPTTDSAARVILRGYEASGALALGAALVPLGLACATGLAGVGLDFGTLYRAGTLKEEAIAEHTVRAPRPDEGALAVTSTSTTTMPY